MNEIKYRYDEDRILNEVIVYIDKTYDQHYSKNKIQTTEFIIDSGHGMGFCLGNIIKYAQRYGKKGDLKDSRTDLMKIIHYAIMAIYNHDNDENLSYLIKDDAEKHADEMIKLFRDFVDENR